MRFNIGIMATTIFFFAVFGLISSSVATIYYDDSNFGKHNLMDTYEEPVRCSYGITGVRSAEKDCVKLHDTKTALGDKVSNMIFFGSIIAGALFGIPFSLTKKRGRGKQ